MRAVRKQSESVSRGSHSHWASRWRLQVSKDTRGTLGTSLAMSSMQTLPAASRGTSDAYGQGRRMPMGYDQIQTTSGRSGRARAEDSFRSSAQSPHWRTACPGTRAQPSRWSAARATHDQPAGACPSGRAILGPRCWHTWCIVFRLWKHTRKQRTAQHDRKASIRRGCCQAQGRVL